MDGKLLTNLKTLEKSILDSIEQISDIIACEETHAIGQINPFGDNQLKIDVLADDILFLNLKNSKLVKYGLSEERPELVSLGGEHFTVSFDPLDGSSIIEVNWAVGTLVAVWPAEHDLIGLNGRKMLTAYLAVYGPRTTVLKYDIDTGFVQELTLKKDEDGKALWVKTKDKIKIGEKTKIFAPANLRATVDNKGYEELFEYWRKNQYTLRYSGGLVPDVYQIFLRGNGIFANPASQSAPAKLRYLFEVAPCAFLIEKAGGKATDGKEEILDLVIESYVMKSTLCVGSASEVERFKQVVGK